MQSSETVFLNPLLKKNYFKKITITKLGKLKKAISLEIAF
jgi:hypothetical protein